MYCKTCQSHWSAVYVPPKRRSRSKSQKKPQQKTHEEDKGEQDSVEWGVFPMRAPWVPTTPALRQNARSQEPQTSQKEVVQASQSTLQPQPILSEPPGLTDSEAKALQHLRGLRSLNMELTEAMMGQLQELTMKEQMTATAKPLTHGHINKMNKYKNQLLSASKRISSLDQEWSNFTNQTMEKIKMHAQLYQKCRADLMEQYNSKIQEFNAVKAEMSAASASLLEQTPLMMELPQMPDLTEQLQAFQTQIKEEGTVGPIDPLDQIDLTEEDEGMEESDGDGASKPTKTSPKLRNFRHATSPQKVANQHLKVKPDKESKDSKKEDKDKSCSEHVDQGGRGNSSPSWLFWPKERNPAVCDSDSLQRLLPLPSETECGLQFSWMTSVQDDSDAMCSFSPAMPVADDNVALDDAERSVAFGHAHFGVASQSDRFQFQPPYDSSDACTLKFETHVHVPSRSMSTEPVCNDLRRSGGGGNVDPSWLRSSSSRKTRNVSFAEKIDLHLFFEEQHIEFSISRAHGKNLCRHFWHLHGQITNWSEIVRIMYGQRRMMDGVNVQHHEVTPQIKTGGCETLEHVRPLLRPDTVAWWWNDLCSLVQEEGRRARFVATWFVSPGRFPLCIQYKRVKIEDSDDFQSFKRRALFAWQALLDDQSVEFHLVEGNPPRSAMILAHVIIVQGKLPQSNFVLFHGVSMPSARRTRAVLFEQDMTVREFFTQAQFPEACQQHHCQTLFHRYLGLANSASQLNPKNALHQLSQEDTVGRELTESYNIRTPIEVSTPLWWSDIGVSEQLALQNRPLWITTWFLTPGHNHVCIRSKRIRISAGMSFQQFDNACRKAWHLLLNGDPLFFYTVEGKQSHELPSTMAHVIIIQGVHDVFSAALLFCSTASPLQQTRAVLFLNDARVREFFLEAQCHGACDRNDFQCYVKFKQDGVDMILCDEEQMLVPMATYLEGDVRLILPEDDSSDVSETSDASTRLTEGEEALSRQVSGEGDNDDVSLVSSHPFGTQVDHINRHPWETAPFEDFAEDNDDALQPDGPAIFFAGSHETDLQNVLRMLREGDEGEEELWIAATFGLGLIDLGRRDLHFHPDNLPELLDTIIEVWRDHAQYGDLLVYTVQPQPIALLGPRTLALIVQVDFPENREPTARCALINEQSSEPQLVRPQPYAARLFNDMSEREVLAMLELHRRCPPFTLRDCHVRLGVTIMQPNQQYEVDDGVLIRPWVGAVPAQVQQAQQHVDEVQQFFLQIQTLREQRPEMTHIMCHVHGLSPAQRPLGHRELVWELDWIYDLEWIEQMETMWPFDHVDARLTFVPSATTDMRETEQITFHFLRAYGLGSRIPILINQQLISVDEMQRDPQPVNEFLAASAQAGQVSPGIMADLHFAPYWFSHTRSQNVHPHLAVNGIRILDVRQEWQPGDVLRARYHVWERHQILTILTGVALQEEEVIFEPTSFLQKRSTRVHADVHASPICTFATVCQELQRQHNEAMLEDGLISQLNCGQQPKEAPIAADSMADVSQQHQAPTWWRHCRIHDWENQSHDEECLKPTLRSSRRGNVDPSVLQGQDEAGERQSTLRHRQRGNVDPLGCQDLHPHADFANGKTPRSNEDCKVASLRKAVSQLMEDNWQGLNPDFTVVPDLHPFAQQACAITEPATSGNIFHVFSDGSKQRSKAAWSFVLLCEANVGNRRKFFRIGYAAALLCDDLGPFQCTALDAEATGLIAASDYLLSKSHKQDCTVFFHYDALSVGHGATGQQNQPMYSDGGSHRQHAARVLVSLLQRKAASVCGLHTKAHVGQPWNECADSIAGQVCKGWSPPRPAILRAKIVLEHPLADWAWLEASPTIELPDLQTILGNHFDDRMHVKPDATLAQTGTCIPSGEHPSLPKRKTIKMATANVGSMNYDGVSGSVSLKANELMHQFQKEGVHIVGIQESRAKQDQFLSQGPFARYIAAGRNGQAGVELWIQAHALAGIFETEFHPEKDATVWLATDRILATRLQFGKLALEIVIAYAPQRGRPVAEIHEWWDQFQKYLDRRDPHALLFILGDMNCHIGSVEGNANSNHCYDFEDEPGRRFRELCEEKHLSIPSTYAHLHTGPSATFIGTRGQESRIDFIAIPEECQQGVVRSYVSHEIDLMNGDRDHLPVCVELAMMVGSQKLMPRFLKKNLYNRQAAREVQQNSRVCMLDDLPQVAWTMDVNDHWDQVRDHLQHTAVARFPCPKRQQRQLYFSPEAWQKLCDRKDLRQQYRQLQRCQTWTLLRATWHAWKDHVQEKPATGYWRLQRFVLQQQEACLYEARLKLDKEFRNLKSKSWKIWVRQQLEDKLQAATKASAADLFKILKPKQMIAKASGRLIKALPGYSDDSGVPRRGRDEVAIAWQAQFGQIEHAEEVSLEELLQRSKPQHQRPRTSEDLAFIPTLYDLEAAIRSLQESKAVGVDGVGPEVFNGNPAIAAQRLFPLIAKGAMRGQAVVEWCGGWLLPLWKKRGNPRDMKGYRAIMLEPVIARAASKSWRGQLLKGLVAVAQPMQWGGRQGLSTEALHLHMQMWRRNARQQQLAQATIFVDIRAAFYSVVKRIVAGSASGMQALTVVFEKMQLPPEMFPIFKDHMEHNNLVYQATKAEILAQSTAATLGHTWFCVPDAATIMSPMTGSRPGDPNADLLFSFVLSKVLKEILQKASQQGIPLIRQTASGEVADIVTWVDDLAISVTASPVELIGKVTTVLHVVQDVMYEHGLALSFGAGKTAVMLAYHGKGAQKAKQHMEQHYKQGIPLLSEFAPGISVPIAAHYKHLGGHVTRSGTRIPELRTRIAAAMAKLRPIRRLLTSETLDVKRRSQLVKSLGLSVYTLHAGALYDLTQGEFTLWQSGVFRLYQTILPRDTEGQVQHITMYQLADKFQSAMPMELLYVHRLRLLVHMIKVADPWMTAMILHNHEVQKEGSWLYGALQALKWARTQIGRECIPDELFQLEDPQAWTWFQPAVKELKKTMKQVEQAHLCKLKTLCALQQHADSQEEILRDMGWAHDSDQNIDMEVIPEQYVCTDCGAAFLQASSLAVHQQRKHGARVALRRFVTDGACRACGKWYHTRPRALTHLQVANPRCWIWHMRRYFPMSLEEAMALDEQDRKDGVAVHQNRLRSQQQDQAWRKCTEDERRDKLRVKCTDETLQAAPEEPTPDEIQQWTTYGMLPPGQGGHEITNRKPKEMQLHHVGKETSALEQRLLARVKGWVPNHDYVPLPLADGRKFFLILFSGHRRPGDLAEWISWLSEEVIPIPVDMAVSKQHGNVFHDHLWQRLIVARKVSGGHAGPPCETFSLARWIQFEEELFPRPLRTTEQPWGCDERNLREVQQALIGTLLMFRALYLLVLIFAHGGSFTLEHPAGCGGRDQKWSIWESAFVKQLLLAGSIKQWTFLQGPLGQPFSKPTNLLAARLEGIGLGRTDLI
eukprot:s1102_g11.t1